MKRDNSMLYISTILEKGSITEAAKALYLSQPSLSQYISRLEQEIGAELFIPNLKPLSLTEAGKLYLQSEERMRAIHAQMLYQIQEIKDLKRGVITIGSSHYRSMTLLVDAIPNFKAKYPGIEIRIEEGHTAALEEAAAKNLTDFSIVMLPLRHPELTYTPLFSEEILLAISPSHPLCRYIDTSKPQCPPYPSIDASFLKSEPIIMIKKGQHLRKTYLALLQELGIEPEIVMETDDMPTAQSLAAVGVGVTLVTDRLAQASIYTRRPIYFSIQQLPEKRQVVAAYDKRYPLSKAARAFLEELKEGC